MITREQVGEMLLQRRGQEPFRVADEGHPAEWHDNENGFHVLPLHLIDPKTGAIRIDTDMAALVFDSDGRSSVTVLHPMVHYSARREILFGKLVVVTMSWEQANDSDEGVSVHLLDANSRGPKRKGYFLPPGGIEVMLAIGPAVLADRSTPPFNPWFEAAPKDNDAFLPKRFRDCLELFKDSATRERAYHDTLEQGKM